MEYLDPKKQRRYRISLWIGYALIAIGIAMGSIILLWQAYGYSVKNGVVIQNGMVFISSQPNPASIYINGKLNASTTNTRLTIPSGAYSLELKAPGYRPWTHVLSVLGGQVIHYDYPILYPVNLTSKNITTFPSAPSFASQSPSQQYLVVADPANFTSFYMYDLTNPTSPPVTLNLPANLLTAAQGPQSWKVVGWANDNRYLLLEHLYNNTQEFIELDTLHPSQSINLNKTFNINPTTVSLNNLNYNQYYFYDAQTQALSSATLGSSTITPVEPSVLAYKSYLTNIVLYVTPTGAPSGQVAVDMNYNNKDYFIRYVPQSTTYLLNMANYNGNNYMVVGGSSSRFVYIYQSPLTQANASKNPKILPFRVLEINNPNYESFAPTAQFIMVESGTDFAVYDIQNDSIYRYTSPMPLESPQTHAVWMDGDRLIYVSGGKLNVADFDNTNRNTLTPALPSYHPFFAPNYHAYFTLSPSSKANSVDLKETSLLVG